MTSVTKPPSTGSVKVEQLLSSIKSKSKSGILVKYLILRESSAIVAYSMSIGSLTTSFNTFKIIKINLPFKIGYAMDSY